MPLKYLSNSNKRKIHLELNWNDDCVMYGADTYTGGDNNNNREARFQTTSTKLYVPVATLSTKDNVNVTEQLDEGSKRLDNVNLAKQLDEGFKRSVYWNEYQ